MDYKVINENIEIIMRTFKRWNRFTNYEELLLALCALGYELRFPDRGMEYVLTILNQMDINFFDIPNEHIKPHVRKHFRFHNGVYDGVEITMDIPLKEETKDLHITLHEMGHAFPVLFMKIYDNSEEGFTRRMRFITNTSGEDKGNGIEETIIELVAVDIYNTLRGLDIEKIEDGHFRIFLRSLKDIVPGYIEATSVCENLYVNPTFRDLIDRYYMTSDEAMEIEFDELTGNDVKYGALRIYLDVINSLTSEVEKVRAFEKLNRLIEEFNKKLVLLLKLVRSLFFCNSSFLITATKCTLFST